MNYLNGVMGVVVGDALGSPVQFHKRGEIIVEGMIPCETFNTPVGAWTDDSSLTLATLFSIVHTGKIDIEDISKRFVQWLYLGRYTPFGYPYDIGQTCYNAIKRYKETGVISGLTDDKSNGNGSLMRIMPACIAAKNVEEVEDVSKITHAHRRSQIGCGLYYFIVQEILSGNGDLRTMIKSGLDNGFIQYARDPEIMHYARMRDLNEFAETQESNIKSTGYIVHTLEAAVWCLINTDSYKSAVKKAVNLGYDADSVGAVCGGLAGLYYGFDSIPKEWIDVIIKFSWIKNLCKAADNA